MTAPGTLPPPKNGCFYNPGGNFEPLSYEVLNEVRRMEKEGATMAQVQGALQFIMNWAQHNFAPLKNDLYCANACCQLC